MGKTVHQQVYLMIHGCLSSFQRVKTRDREGCGVARNVPVIHASPSRCTGFVHLQKKPRMPLSTTAEETDFGDHYHPGWCPQTSLQGVKATDCSIPPGTRTCPQWQEGVRTPAHSPLLGPLNPVENPLPTQAPTANTKPANHMPWGCGEK